MSENLGIVFDSFSTRYSQNWLLLTIDFNHWVLPVFAPQSLPNHSLISPWLLPDRSPIATSSTQRDISSGIFSAQGKSLELVILVWSTRKKTRKSLWKNICIIWHLENKALVLSPIAPQSLPCCNFINTDIFSSCILSAQSRSLELASLVWSRITDINRNIFTMKTSIWTKSCIILGSVSDKCPGFCKCLKFSKSRFATFLNSTGCQKWPALSASDQKIVMVVVTTIKYMLRLLITSML